MAAVSVIYCATFEMKTILFMAMSMNGIVAREDNSEDFISDENWDIFVKLARTHGNVVWGRKTYEVVRKWENTYLDSLEGVRKVIVSREGNRGFGNDCIHAVSPGDAIQKLESEGCKTVFVSGGSTLNAAFAKGGLLDEIIVNVNPVVIGKGIPIFGSEEFDLELEMVESKLVSTQILQVRYRVMKSK